VRKLSHRNLPVVRASGDLRELGATMALAAEMGGVEEAAALAPDRAGAGVFAAPV
jgi:hypothetical protein